MGAVVGDTASHGSIKPRDVSGKYEGGGGDASGSMGEVAERSRDNDEGDCRTESGWGFGNLNVVLGESSSSTPPSL